MKLSQMKLSNRCGQIVCTLSEDAHRSYNPLEQNQVNNMIMKIAMVTNTHCRSVLYWQPEFRDEIRLIS